MADNLRHLLLVPTGAVELLSDEHCDERNGRVPQMLAPGGERSDDAVHDGRALALVYDGRVLPLAWWRACAVYRAADGTGWLPQAGELPTIEQAVALATIGATDGLWRVVEVRP